MMIEKEILLQDPLPHEAIHWPVNKKPYIEDQRFEGCGSAIDCTCDGNKEPKLSPTNKRHE